MAQAKNKLLKQQKRTNKKESYETDTLCKTEFGLADV
jgi:hypothetical protein